MNVIILAAGYGTRLYPLTKDTPKPLLPVGNKPMMEHILEHVAQMQDLENIYIVTNAKFFDHFQAWLNRFDSDLNIEIINDQTIDNETRRGAIGDIQFVVEQKNLNSDVMVIAGDNLFDESLANVQSMCNRNRQQSHIVVYDVKEKSLATQYGVLGVDHENTVTSFVEKPAEPESTLISTGIYFFPQEVMALIPKYLEAGNDPDKSGSFIQWLFKEQPVKAIVTHKKWHDIGSHEQLKEANEHYSQ